MDPERRGMERSLAKYLLGLMALAIGLVLEVAGWVSHSRPILWIGLVLVVLGAAQIAWKLARRERR